MENFKNCFISLIIICKNRKKKALLRCTANQADTGHKLHFQPKNPARAKLAAINNKNGCGMAEVWCRQFGSASKHLYYRVKSGKRQLCSVVLPTKSAQGISSIFSLNIQLGPNSQQSTTKMAVARQRFDEDSSDCFISLILTFKVRKRLAKICCTANQAGTGDKLNFQPKHPAEAKFAAINNKNGCGMDEMRRRQFRSISYHWYYLIRSEKRQLCSVVPITKLAQAKALFSAQKSS